MTQAIPTYLVRDRQGNIFGPADEATLRAWVGEGRIVAGMELALNGPLATRRWEEASSHPAVADLLRGQAQVAEAAGPGSTGNLSAVVPAGLGSSGAGTGGSGGSGVMGTGVAGDGGSLGYATPTQKTNTLALLSVIFGSVGLLGGVTGICCCPLGVIGLLLAVAAIVTGAIGLSQIKANPEAYSGRQMAMAGLILGIAAIVLDVGGSILLLLVQFAGHHV